MPMVVSHPVWLQLQLSRRMRRRTRRPWLNSHHSQADAPSCQVPPPSGLAQFGRLRRSHTDTLVPASEASGRKEDEL